MIHLKKSVDPSFAMSRKKIVRFFSSLFSYDVAVFHAIKFITFDEDIRIDLSRFIRNYMIKSRKQYIFQ